MIARHTPELILILFGLTLRVGFALLPIEQLFVLLEDDAWMVTAIARNWAEGLGITADGVNPTNGFHPLYPLTLGALPYLVPLEGLHSGFRVNLIICALLNTLALLPFYGLARAVASRPVALAGLAIMALNPFLVRVSVNAMETSLALLLLLTLWWAALVHPPSTLKGGLLLGVLAALTMLARLDSAIAAGFIGLWFLCRELAERHLPWATLGYGLAGGLFLLPYFVRNLLMFDSLSPSSGRALAYMHSYAESFTFTAGLQLLAYQPALDLTWAPTWLLALGLVGLAVIYFSLPREPRWLLAPLLLYALTLTFYYAYIQQQGRPRYYVAIACVLVLLLCARFSSNKKLADPSEWRLKLAPLALVIAVVIMNSALTIQYARQVAQAPYQAQPAMFNTARWIAGNLPPDAQIAAQNSGIFQYYSERVVLNVDGKLNHEIVPVLTQRALDRYLHDQDIDYIVDLPGVGRYVEFYSSSLSVAAPHAELSTGQKLQIHVRRVAARLGLGPPVELAVREPERVLRPFDTVTTTVHEEPLPNDPTTAVTVYRLAEDFGAGGPP